MDPIVLPGKNDFWCFRDDEAAFNDVLANAERLLTALEKPEILNKLVNGREDGERPDPNYSVEDGIARIRVAGAIIPQCNWIGNLFGFTGWNQVQDWVGQALNDKGVRGYILHITSGGGGWMGNSATMDYLQSVKGVKPWASHIDGIGCSAAKCLAMQASYISASRDSETESLGTIQKHTVYKDDNVIQTVLRSGKKKALGYVQGEELTPEAKQSLEERLNEVNAMFLANCSRGRPQNSVEFLQSLEGADFMASKALELGLIDNVCSLDEAVGRLQEMIRMNELLQALGASNEKEAAEKVQAISQKTAELEAKVAATESVLNVTNGLVAKLNEVTGQPSLEQAVATVSAWKMTVDAVPSKDQKIKDLEGKNTEIRLNTLLEKNQAKITADLKPKIEEQRELAMAAGKDPVAVVQSFLDAMPAVIDTTNYTPADGKGNGNETGPAALTEEQERHFQATYAKHGFSREDYLKALKG